MDMNTIPVPANVSNQPAQTSVKSSPKAEKKDSGSDRRPASRTDKKGKNTFDAQLSKAKQADEKSTPVDQQDPAETAQNISEKKDPTSESPLVDKKTETAKSTPTSEDDLMKSQVQASIVPVNLLSLLTQPEVATMQQATTMVATDGSSQNASGGASAENLPASVALPVNSLDALLPKDMTQTAANENLLALLTSKATLAGSVQKDEKTSATDLVQAMLQETKGQPAADPKNTATVLTVMKNADLANLQTAEMKAVPEAATTAVNLSAQAVKTVMVGDPVKNAETTAVQQSTNGTVLQQAIVQTQGNSVLDQTKKNSKSENNKSGDVKAADKNAAEVKQDLFSLTGMTVEKTETVKPVTPLAAQLQDMQQKAALVSEAKEEAAAAKNILPELTSEKEAPLKKENTSLEAGKALTASITPFAETLKQSANAVQPQNVRNMDAYEIPKQIVEQAKLIKSAENSQMVIKLNPDHLGELVLKVSVSSNGSVNASFHSDNADVRTVIENSLVQLRQELQSQGLKVDNVGVYAGLGDLMSNGQSSQMNQQQAGSNGRHRQIRLEDAEEEMELSAISSTEGLNAEDGIDYRI